MTLAAGTVNVGGSSSVTGGTSTGMLYRGQSNSGLQVNYILDDASEYLALTKVEFSAVDAKVNTGAPNGYTQQRNSVVLKVPLALDNGKVTTNTVRIEVATDIETTDAEKLELREKAAQILYGSAYTEFWDSQTLS